MPIRTFSNTAVINTTVTGEQEHNGNNNLNKAEFTFSGSGTATGEGGDVYAARCLYAGNAQIDLTQFPTIPETATITKVELRIRRHVAAGVAQPGSGPCVCFDQLELFTYSGDLNLDPTITLVIQENEDGTGGSSASLVLAQEVLTTEIEGAYSYDSFVEQFTQIAWDYRVAAAGSSTDEPINGSADMEMDVFELVVTWTGERYSWYIRPTPTQLNGESIAVIETEDDIVAVPDGETPPEGFELFGSSQEFPDGPVYVWWVQEDTEDSYWIFSPIQPAEGWVALSTDPVCSLCNTISLGTLEILIANASGIYYLEVGKLSDTLYVRGEGGEQTTTIEVKKPNPFVKTGLVP